MQRTSHNLSFVQVKRSLKIPPTSLQTVFNVRTLFAHTNDRLRGSVGHVVARLFGGSTSWGHAADEQRECRRISRMGPRLGASSKGH